MDSTHSRSAPTKSRTAPTLYRPSSLASADQRRKLLQTTTTATHRAQLGQFLTPAPLARFIASLFDLEPGPARLLDPGAGVGALSAAFADRWTLHSPDPLSITAIEIDPSLQPFLRDTLAELTSEDIVPQQIEADFVHWMARSELPLQSEMAEFDYAVLNPPYRKISQQSQERTTLRSLGIEVTNLYAGFLALAARSLRPGGQLVAITPRSFTNGPYFRAFRRDFLGRMALSRIHSIDARDLAFADDDVLQETIVFHAKRAKPQPTVIISSGTATDRQATTWHTPLYAEVVSADEPAGAIRIPRDEIDTDINARMRRLPCTVGDLNLSVSTGQVVEFRARPHLKTTISAGDAPLLYPRHLTALGELAWPGRRTRYPIAIAHNAETAPQLMPNGAYVLVKRFSAKEERKRIVASTTAAWHHEHQFLAFENHLNVFHTQNQPLSPTLALGLSAFLNSTIVDLFFRQRSGHTQVNATDLRSLRYPALDDLNALGKAIDGKSLEQVALDDLVATHLPVLQPLDDKKDFLMAHRRITQAQQTLRDLGLPQPQTNERSALALLAVLNLTPDKDWSEIEAPLMGITPMMEFMDEHYGRRYAPNSRETIRRQTVHQFVDAGLLTVNPDDPKRPTNSGLTVYQVPSEVLEILRQYETEDWDDAVAEWERAAPSLKARWLQEREMRKIPVKLPDGEEVRLSPGGQNPLIKALLEDFCPRFVPGGHVLYVGDAQDKFAVHDAHGFEVLGIQIDEHGKMPDLVVSDEDRGWLFLIEAVTTHGPVDPKRRDELNTLFAGTDVGLVYITAFQDRSALSRYLNDISWETEVWVADSPSHLIHFDGERFLGPYC